MTVASGYDCARLLALAREPLTKGQEDEMAELMEANGFGVQSESHRRLSRHIRKTLTERRPKP